MYLHTMYVYVYYVLILIHHKYNLYKLINSLVYNIVTQSQHLIVTE